MVLLGQEPPGSWVRSSTGVNKTPLSIYNIRHIYCFTLIFTQSLVRTVYYLYFVDEETDDQRSKGTPSNSHGSEMVELGYHRSHSDVKIPGPIGIMGKTVECSF